MDVWLMEDDQRFWDPMAERWLKGREEERSRAEAFESHAGTAESRVTLLEAECRRLRGEENARPSPVTIGNGLKRCI